MGVEATLAGLSFKSPNRATKDRSKIVGYARRTLFDLSVWVSGRIVFNAKPDVSKAPGYWVADADIHIVNKGAGALDISHVKLPERPTLVRYEKAVGERVSFSKDSGGLLTTVAGPLTWDTEIESRGEVKTLLDWLPVVQASKGREEAAVRSAIQGFRHRSRVYRAAPGRRPVRLRRRHDAKIHSAHAGRGGVRRRIRQRPQNDNSDPPPDPARDPWSRLRAALHWSGADRAQNSGSGIAWLEPGIAIFGSRKPGRRGAGSGVDHRPSRARLHRHNQRHAFGRQDILKRNLRQRHRDREAGRSPGSTASNARAQSSSSPPTARGRRNFSARTWRSANITD